MVRFQSSTSSRAIMARLLATLAWTAILLGVVPAQADMLVSSGPGNSIVRFDNSGALVGNFASGGSLNNPNGLVYGPGDDVYVANLVRIR